MTHACGLLLTLVLLPVLLRFAARWLTFWWGYDLMHEYLLTGRFAWCMPSLFNEGGMTCVFQVQDQQPPMDWFGVNYYSR